MSESTAKTFPVRFVRFVGAARALAMALSSALISCASGGTPAAFSTDGTPASYDAAAGGAATGALGGGDASADDGTYGQVDAASCGSPSQEDSADAREDADGGADNGGSAAVEPGIGDLIITEIMFDPSGPVPEAQWFEVYNLTGAPELLSGLTIQDSWGDAQVISDNPPVIAPPFAYVVLVRDLGTADANGIPDASIVYEYGGGLSPAQGIEFASDWTGDVSLWNGGAEIVDVPYGDWGLSYAGDSIELASLQYLGADQSGNWCVAQRPWAPGSDYGTPGLPSDCF